MKLQAVVLSLVLNLALGASTVLAQKDGKDKTPEPAPVDLKKQRDLADAFMRKAAERALKNDPAVAASREGFKGAKDVQAKLQKRLAAKRFFGSGTADKDLTAFKEDLQAADKAGIKLSAGALDELIKAAVFNGIGDGEIKAVAAEVAQQQGATADGVLRAVSAEFRARIARDLKAKQK